MPLVIHYHVVRGMEIFTEPISGMFYAAECNNRKQGTDCCIHFRLALSIRQTPSFETQLPTIARSTALDLEDLSGLDIFMPLDMQIHGGWSYGLRDISGEDCFLRIRGVSGAGS
jgi:hypothetical protein